MAGRMRLADILAGYVSGDEDPLREEFDFLRREHPERIAFLTVEIAENGQKEPVILGSDGRVLDGHHRLAVIDALDGPQAQVWVSHVKVGGEE